nr:dnaJ homolog subfamily C member 4-like [Osmia lignaria]
MAQICRMNKSEVPVLIRILNSNYRCCKRHKTNYYDVLRIPQDATQKEIKEAFIRLSKEMHPDCGNKGSHDDFIKLNEAYSVLSKKDTKHYYDFEVKYNDSANCDFHSHRFYNFNDLCEVQNNEQFGKDKAKVLGVCVAIMIFGTIMQLIRIKMWSDFNKRAAAERNLKRELEYQNFKEQREEILKLKQFKLDIHNK